jgi:hypothetical protein
MPLDVVGNTSPAKKYTHFDNWTKILVQVRDASTIFLSTNRKALEVPGPGGLQGGLAVTGAGVITTLDWKGDLWIIGSNPQSTYDIETFEDSLGPTGTPGQACRQ